MNTYKLLNEARKALSDYRSENNASGVGCIVEIDHEIEGRCFLVLKCGLNDFMEFYNYEKEGIKKIICKHDVRVKNGTTFYYVEIDGEIKKYFTTFDKSEKYLIDIGFIRVSDPDGDKLCELKPHYRQNDDLFNVVRDAYIGWIEAE